MIESVIGRIAGGEDLSQAEAQQVFDLVMEGQCTPPEIALLLTGLSLKGESVEEIAGAATSLRRHMTPICTRRSGLLDTCGTGGDGSATFNISTAAALVTAAAGVPVAKHGNRRATSRTGSADVLEVLGVNVNADVPQVEACLEELGICFCFAPLLHRAMKQVSEVRRQLERPTIFNMLGPLSNPAGAEYQLLGVGQAQLRPLLSQTLERLGTKRAMVVCGNDGLDEVTLSGVTFVTEVTPEGLKEHAWHPADFGIKVAPLDELKVDGPEQSAAVIRKILAGEKGPARDIVVLNAAAGMLVAGAAATPSEGAEKVAAAIDSGAAGSLLARLIERSHA